MNPRIIVPALLCAILTLAATTARAQSRMPDIKVAPKATPAPRDTSGMDERPYFLLIEQSEQALADNDYAAAALRLVEAMAVEPDNELNIALLSNLGMIYYYDGLDSLALTVLDKAIERSPRFKAPRENRARVLLGLGRDDMAYEEYGRIIALDSIDTSARFMHAMMALHRHRLDIATADIAVLERIIPLHRDTRLARATLYSLTGRELQAVSLLRDLISIEPALPYFQRMAACQLVLDDLQGMAETIGQGLERYPGDPGLLLLRAQLNQHRYRPDEAQRDARQALQAGADPDAVRQVLGQK